MDPFTPQQLGALKLSALRVEAEQRRRASGLSSKEPLIAGKWSDTARRPARSRSRTRSDRREAYGR